MLLQAIVTAAVNNAGHCAVSEESSKPHLLIYSNGITFELVSIGAMIGAMRAQKTYYKTTWHHDTVIIANSYYHTLAKASERENG